MAYDLEEQEQIDTLKAWWKQYGNLATWLLIAGLSAFAGWTAWTNYQHGQAAQASTIYEELQRAAGVKDNAKVQGAATNLVEKYARTSYATMAALTAARSAFDANDMKSAKTQLTWVAEHGQTKEFQALAKLRLTSILLDEKNYDDALKVLSGDFSTEFEADVLDRKADVFVAQNKIKEARETYKAALDKMGEKHAGRQLVQIKLDALGGAIDAKVAVTSEKK
ncbi:YfgM family protein [Undibacterium sp. Ji22W]|uniref:YfgM family protein n=1 Tax=Undibacterium sp. Ji22W TaxID=3413038 RepID=UPI003BF2FA8B